jgi:hypothetical protein
MNYGSLVSLTVNELKDLARKRGFNRYASLRKAQLINALMADTSASDADAVQFTALRCLRTLESEPTYAQMIALRMGIDIKGKSDQQLCNDIAWYTKSSGDAYPMTDCERWRLAERRVNPTTFRKISPGKPVYEQLYRRCDRPDRAKALLGPTTKGKFAGHKNQLVRYYFKLFDDIVYDNRLKGKVRVEWHSQLIKTVGVTSWIGDINVCRIDLASALIVNKEAIRDVMAHEMCHAAVLLIDKLPTAACQHKAPFKKWVRKTEREFPTLPKITIVLDVRVPPPLICKLCGSKYVDDIVCEDCLVSLERNPSCPSNPIDIHPDFYLPSSSGDGVSNANAFIRLLVG